MQNLVERLEAAKGPDAFLDAMVACADNGWAFVRLRGQRSLILRRKDGTEFTCRLYNGRFTSLKYTASIDVALTLLSDDLYLIELRQINPKWWTATVGSKSDEATSFCSDAKTGAMAITAAALQARQPLPSTMGTKS